MRVSDQMKALLSMRGSKLSDLAGFFGIKPQSMSNKIVRNNWTAEELLKIAEFCGCKVAFVFPDGQLIYLPNDETVDKQKSPDA